MMLPSLRVQGFRCFRDLTIPRLGRVNLVVGRNNSGKTTLLEALSVYAAGLAAGDEIQRILVGREESRAPGYMKPQSHLDPTRVFYQPPEGAWQISFSVGPLDKPEATLRIALMHPDENKPDAELSSRTNLVLKLGDRRQVVPVATALDADAHSRRDWRDAVQDGPAPAHPAVFVRVGALEARERLRLWNAATLSKVTNEVVRALRVIAPEVERIDVGSDGKVRVRRRDLRNVDSLASLGGGMNRLFALALGLLDARGGLFLADEIENGLHYSAHEPMWRFIAATAARLGVQVVATTHSWDCIEGFQAAEIEDSLLIRLDRRGEDTFAVLFDERDVAIATRGSIDIR